MISLHALRRARGLTIVDVALITGVPARILGAIEYGTRPLDIQTRTLLAQTFAVGPHTIGVPRPPALQHALRERLIAEARLASPALAAALATAALAAAWLPRDLPAPHAAFPASERPDPRADTLPQSLPAPRSRTAFAAAAPPADFAGLASLVERAAQRTPAEPTTEAALPAPTTEAALPAPVPIVASAAPADGSPLGCPLVGAGAVVVNQGYGVGSHAPAAIWGALDLGLDADGDGMSEPASTLGALIFTPNAGTAIVRLGSWPGGNYVRIVNQQTGWSTAYAHLDQVYIGDGQIVEAGTVIGTVGMTGMTTGPHLHYEVWHAGQNTDPTPFLDCAP